MSGFPPPIDQGNLGRGPMIMGLTWTFTALAAIAATIRLIVRQKVHKHCGLDDWIMFLAAVLQVVAEALIAVSYHYGMGKHDHSLTADQMVQVLKWNWISSLPGMIVSIIARISIAILLVRLFGVRVWFKRFMICTTTLQSLLCTAIIFCTWLQSTPVTGLWDIYDTKARHWDYRIVLYMEFLGQSMYTFSDLTYVLLPTIIIWKLRMPLRQRLALVGLMAFSLFTMVMSILKTKVAQGSSYPSVDAQYKASLGVLWANLEEASVIIMGCVPPLRSIAKLDIVRTVSSSLSSILKHDRSKQSLRDLKDSSGRYADLELSTAKLGHLDGCRGAASTVVTTYQEGMKSQDSLEETGGIRHTHDYNVSYGRNTSAV